MSKHLLLISYTFPPYPGIGGRRWAKFAKYLSRLGYTIHVIHSKNPFKEESLWLDDVKNAPNIFTYELDALYPKVLLSQPTTFFEKLNYRFSLFKVKMFSKGTPYDRGIFWKKPMVELAERLIVKNNIKNVIVSCAPFSSAYYALELKQRHKDLNLIIDLRDPWTWGKAYGFSSLSDKRLSFEKKMEREVIEKSDYILVPSVEMKNHIASSYSEFSKKIVFFSHGFDEDELTRETKIKSDKIRLMFYGTIYENLERTFEAISKAIKNTEPIINLDIYSSTTRYRNLFEQKNILSKTVNYYKPLSPVILFNKMKEYDYVIVVQPDYAKDFITTKIYEIIYTGTPIILISNEGKLSDFISSYKLGFYFNSLTLEEGFKNLPNSNAENFQVKKFPINDFSFKSITTQLTNYFK